MSRANVAACLLAALAATARAGEWPSFRGPEASGVADGHPLPISWSAETGTNVLWKTRVPGLGLSSPVLWGDRIFLTTALNREPEAEFRHGLYGDITPAGDAGPQTWKVLAYDRRTGRLVWERVAHEGVPRAKRHPKNTFATPSIATDGRHVIAFFGSEGLYAYDVEGTLLWKKDLGVLSAGWFRDPGYEWGVSASPILHEGLVIVQCDVAGPSFVAAFDAASGREVWRAPREEHSSFGTPTVVSGGSSGPELVTHASNFIRGYDPKTGAELWRLAPNSEITTPTPFAADGLVFVTNGYRAVQPIYAIKPGGHGDISPKPGASTSEHVAWSTTRGGPYTPTPVVYGELLYVCSNNGVLSVYEARTGLRLYQERIAGRGGAYSASPVAGDGKIYLPSEDGEIFVVKAGPQYELLAENAMGEVLMATPAISNGVLYVRGLKHLFAIGAPAAASAGDAAAARGARP